MTDLGWTLGSHPRTWQKDTLQAWLPEGQPSPVLEVTPWEREVEEEWASEGLDPVYDEATGVVRDHARLLRESELGARVAAEATKLWFMGRF